MTRIGTSDLDILPLTLGGNVFGWTASKEQSFDVLDAFLAAGGSSIDTADSYSAWIEGHTGGESELIIGEWMSRRGNRDDVVLATKVSQHPEFRGLAPENVIAAADASLTRLGTDRIDLYYAHFDDETVPLEETLGALDSLVRAGKVRYLAISNYTADRIDRWISIAQDRDYALPVALQPHYNLVHREPFEAELAPRAEKYGLGVMPYFSLAAGLLTGKYAARERLDESSRARQIEGYVSDQAFATVDAVRDIAAAHGVAPASVALAWLRHQPTVVAPIASARTVEQLPDLLASATLELTAEDRSRLDAVSAPDGEKTLS